MVKVSISFKETPRELELYNYLKGKINLSAYVKELIERDMELTKEVEK